jgi:hypothetical protein
MKSAWKGDIQDLAAWNSDEVETVVDLREYEDILTQDNEIAAWEGEDDSVIFD